MRVFKVEKQDCEKCKYRNKDCGSHKCPLCIVEENDDMTFATKEDAERFIKDHMEYELYCEMFNRGVDDARR